MLNSLKLVPTLCVGMQMATLLRRDTNAETIARMELAESWKNGSILFGYIAMTGTPERPKRHYHAERGNDNI